MRLHGKLPDIVTGDSKIDHALRQWKAALDVVHGSTWNGDSGLALSGAGSGGIDVSASSGGGSQVGIQSGGVTSTHLASGVAGGGLTGGAGSALSVNMFREVPSGTVNGANTSFSISHSAHPDGEMVYVDGLLQQDGADYTLSGTSLTFTVAPAMGAKLYVIYFRA